jgi:hypothetical protein
MENTMKMVMANEAVHEMMRETQRQLVERFSYSSDEAETLMTTVASNALTEAMEGLLASVDREELYQLERYQREKAGPSHDSEG